VHDIWLLASKQQAGIEAKQTKNDKHNLALKDKCESASQPSWWKVGFCKAGDVYHLIPLFLFDGGVTYVRNGWIPFDLFSFSA
jgi:hypothetical protein